MAARRLANGIKAERVATAMARVTGFEDNLEELALQTEQKVCPVRVNNPVGNNFTLVFIYLFH